MTWLLLDDDGHADDAISHRWCICMGRPLRRHCCQRARLPPETSPLLVPAAVVVALVLRRLQHYHQQQAKQEDAMTANTVVMTAAVAAAVGARSARGEWNIKIETAPRRAVASDERERGGRTDRCCCCRCLSSWWHDLKTCEGTKGDGLRFLRLGRT